MTSSEDKAGPRSVDIDVFGQRFTVRSDNSDDRIREIVGFANQRLESISQKAGTSPTDRIALLCVVTLAEELTALQAENVELKEAVRDRASQLLGALDELQELHTPTEALGAS